MAFCLNLILNYNNSFYDLKKHVFNPTGFTLFPNDWFIYALIICYLIFYITNTVKIYAGRFIFSFAMLCPFVVFCAYSGWHRNWWATPMAFLMGGVIYYPLEDKINNLNTGLNRYLKINIVLLCCYLTLLVLGMKIGSRITTTIVYSSLPIWIIICLTHIDFRNLAKNRILLFLGNISFEIYLLHGIIMEFLRNNTSVSEHVFF